MAKQVVFRSDVPVSYRTYDPEGKEIVFAFTKENDLMCSIPADLSYFNKWKKAPEIYAHKFAQGLLDGHSNLHLVEEIELPAVVEKVVDKKSDEPKPGPVEAPASPKKRPGRPRKDEKHEAVQETPAI